MRLLYNVIGLSTQKIIEHNIDTHINRLAHKNCTSPKVLMKVIFVSLSISLLMFFFFTTNYGDIKHTFSFV